MIIAIKPPVALANSFSVEGGLRPSTLHFTLFFLGKSSEIPQEKYTEYVQAIKDAASTTSPFTVTFTGQGKFEKVRMTTDSDGNMVAAAEPTDVVFLKGAGEELYSFRAKLADILDERDLYYSKIHKEFTPHMSLKYVPHGEELNLGYPLPTSFVCDRIDLWGDGDGFKQEIKLG